MNQDTEDVSFEDAVSFDDSEADQGDPGIVQEGILKTLGVQTAYDLMVAAPMPEKTSTYTPVGHGHIDDYIKQVVSEMGISIVDQEYKISSNGQVAMGLYTLDRQTIEKPMQFRIAWRNSYDKSRKFSLATGLRIMACGNGAFWGDSGNLTRSHRGDLDFDFRRLVENEVSRMDSKLTQGLELEHRWGRERLTRRQWEMMFGEIIMETKLITPTMLNPLREDVKNGPFKVQGDGSHTRWNMYMNITHALKIVNPGIYIKLQKEAHATMDIIKAPSFAL